MSEGSGGAGAKTGAQTPLSASLGSSATSRVMTLPNRTIDVITDELHVALRRETADILTIGGLLAEAKEQVPHGEWLPWLKNEFSMSERSAQKYVKAADFVAKYELGADLKLSPSALFLLSRYDRREVTDAVIKAAKEKRLGCDQAKQIIDKTLAELDVTNEAKSEESAANSVPQHGRRSGVNPRDDLIFNFTAIVLELHRLTKSNQAERFAKSHVGADILAGLGQRLTDIANFKKTEAVKPTFKTNPVGAREELS
jgi:hypothetical protein